jgi:hypothetical protein
VDVEAAAQLARIGYVFDQVVRACSDGQLPAWPREELNQLRDLCGRLAVDLTQSKVVTTDDEMLE